MRQEKTGVEVERWEKERVRQAGKMLKGLIKVNKQGRISSKRANRPLDV